MQLTPMPVAARQLWSCRFLSLSVLLLTTLLISRAEQLPVRTYTTADGLPRDAVTHVEQDSRGFIWIVAGDGLYHLTVARNGEAELLAVDLGMAQGS